MLIDFFYKFCLYILRVIFFEENKIILEKFIKSSRNNYIYLKKLQLFFKNFLKCHLEISLMKL